MEHVIKGHLVGASSFEGMRMSLHLRRIGGISEEEHAADVDGKIVQILRNNDCVEVGGGSGTPGAPLLLSCLLYTSPSPRDRG